MVTTDNTNLANLTRDELEDEYRNVCWFLTHVLLAIDGIHTITQHDIDKHIDERYRLYYDQDEHGYVVQALLYKEESQCDQEL